MRAATTMAIEGPPYHPCPICGELVDSMRTDRKEIGLNFGLWPNDDSMIEAMCDRPVYTATPCGHSWIGIASLYLKTLTIEWHEAQLVMRTAG